MDSDRVINFNRGHATLVAQHGILMVNEQPWSLPWEDGVAGQAVHSFPTIFVMGPPKNVVKVQIDREGAIGDIPGTVAHELGHATGLWHHGTGSFSLSKGTIFPSGTLNDLSWRRTHKSADGTLSGHKLPKEFYIGNKHDQRSGNYDCIMRYGNPSITVYQVSSNQWELGPSSDHPTTFCDSPAGTKSNANGHCAGDAKRGDCIHQFVVSDLSDGNK
jgi:hypothetical protein